MNIRQFGLFACLASLVAAAHVNAQQFAIPSDYAAIERTLQADLRTCLARDGGSYKGAKQCADHVSPACIAKSPDGETTAGYAICGSVSGNVLDRDMNVVWSQIKRKADRRTFADLLAKQRRWLASRETEARAAAAANKGGSMSAYTGAIKYIDMTTTRLAQLYEINAGL